MRKNMKIVVALGGNALGNTPIEQQEAVKLTAKSIVDLVAGGHKVVVGHGNGPQVGMIALAFEDGKKVNNNLPLMPLSLSGAMSQGYIGLQLQQAIKNELNLRKINNDVVSLITQTLVDVNDPSFSNPTKPIGSFYSETEAKTLANKNNWTVKEDSGRGWRRVVPSPKPIDILEKNIVIELFKQGTIVIAGGGGGIPTIIDKKGLLKDVDAVIDKDFTSEKLAELIKADLFMIITAVDGIYKDYGTPTEKKLDKISSSELKKLIDSGMFPEGSMKPKAEAAYQFVNNTSNKTVITSLENITNALEEKHTTIIYK